MLPNKQKRAYLTKIKIKTKNPKLKLRSCKNHYRLHKLIQKNPSPKLKPH